MKQIDGMKMMIEFLNKGVVPMGWGVPNGARLDWDMNRILSEMDPREARRMRRKFRKVWRNAVKTHVKHGGKKGSIEAKRTGLGEAQPTRKHKMCRKGIVYQAIHVATLPRG